jgi:hypothetical protein
MPELATHEREALLHWMRDCTEVLSGLLPEVHMPAKRHVLAGLLRRMEQHAAVLGDTPTAMPVTPESVP